VHWIYDEQQLKQLKATAEAEQAAAKQGAAPPAGHATRKWFQRLPLNVRGKC
jgi:hypothetical protein